ncbi:monovalent cation/H+ antiporter subunit D family protein [Pararhodospirillum oryzae]|uniref:Cation:proton antiporter n=1 Tax=Pararhodospirillum oryzae TaxID=478448 RepID=A0A512HBH6_9PROT|nr:monovalent cation/H+ antiporter subunit D family protein [Pararhodospirillum oryzae]GEO82807.1 cation:proton antiporter [Pararhodospirillum oryzae]
MTLLAHLPPLQMVLPLMAGPVCLLLGRPRLCAVWALAVAGACLAIALTLLGQILDTGVISYHVGGWEPPWGIELRLDALSGLMLSLVSAIAVVVLLYAPASVRHEIPADRQGLFYTLFLLNLAGLLGMCTTGDAFNLFVFLEISSLSTYTLVSLGRGRSALRAAYVYLVLGTVGATFYVIGLGLLYMITGTLNMVDLAQHLVNADNPRTLLVGAGFVVVGLSIKLALFPLHKWLPGAYTHAPSVVSAFMAATGTKVALYVLLRLAFTVLAPSFSALHLPHPVTVEGMALILGLTGMISASVSAFLQTDLKRMLAYSSVAQIGLMVAGAALLTPTSVTGSLVHLINHAVLKATVFLALGGVLMRLGSVRLEDLAGAGRRLPLTMGAFLLGALSLVGIPGTAGFIGKWTLLLAALEQDRWGVAVLIGAGSLLTLAYVWRVVEVAWLRPAPAQAARVPEIPLSMLVPLGVVGVANLVFGVYTAPTLGLARAASTALLGGATP